MKKLIAIIVVAAINITVLRAFDADWNFISVYITGYLTGGLSWAIDFKVKVKERN